MKKSPNDAQVGQTLRILAEKREELMKLWQLKETHLEDMLELQLFSREADHIDAATKGHEAVLDLIDLGVNSNLLFIDRIDFFDRFFAGFRRIC